MSVETLGGVFFTLQAAPNAAEFTSLFDQYRILQVQASITPDSQSEGTPIYTVIDYDDASTPTSAAELREYGTCQQTSFTTGFFQRVFQPRAAMAAYSGAFTSFAQSQPGQWFDVASPAIQHYGFKYAIAPTPSLVEHVEIMFTVIYQFKNNR